MITLLPNTASQILYCTPFSSRKDYDVTITNYLFVVQSLQTDAKYYFIANVDTDNARYTEISISTNVDAATSGNILLTDSGQYSYIIYGQTNATNLDPTNIVVIGELERGLMTFTGDNAWTTPSISIPNNVVYYE